MKKILLYMLLLLPMVAEAQHYTVSGTVTDVSTGETLIGATVLDLRSGKGTVTNAYGYYSLTLNADSVMLRVSYVGYVMSVESFVLQQNARRNYSLKGSTELEEVIVTAERVSSPRSSQISAIAVPVEHLKAVPVLFGESDVLKALQLLPGVQSGGEGKSGIYVRGGGPDENLFLLDGVSIYNVNHLGGFFSAFNSDAVKNVTLYKGSFPARFGGRISSVLDIATNNGNDKELHGNASVGIISAKVNIEGPIVKEKTTFSISARRTYADLLLQPVMMATGLATQSKNRGGYYFYDLNTKITHKFSDRSRLYGSFYSGDDVVYASMETRDGAFYDHLLRYSQQMKFNTTWGNTVGSLRWNYELTPKLFMNVSGAYTRYRSSIMLGYVDQYFYPSGEILTNEMAMTYNSGIRDVIGKVEFDYQPNPDHAIKFGGTVVNHLFSPEVMSLKDSASDPTVEGYNYGFDTVLGESHVYANEMNLYIEDDWSLNDAWKINGGLMMSGFAVQQRFYPSLQPRLSSRVMLTEDLSLKVGYSYMTQYLHLLSNTSINLPFDLWVPVTAKITPMHAHQVAGGVFYSWRGLLDLSAEAYYKDMDNLMEYRDGASFWGSSTQWEDKVCLGRGWSYGVELLAQKSVGKLTGWVGYTWSKTERLFDRKGQELNNGLTFPAKYDRRHDISVVMMYKPNDDFDFSVTWVYNTGTATTLALQTYEGEPDDDEYYYPYYDEYLTVYGDDYVPSRNNYRMPAYHRMDLSMNFHKQKKHGRRTINVSIYNVYSRKNPYMVFRSDRYGYTYNNVRYGSALVSLTMFPIMPSVSYSFKF